MVTVFRDGSHRFGTHLIRILHFLPPYSPAPFFQTLVIDSENQELGASALFGNEKSRDSYGFTPQKSRQVSK